MPDLKQELWNAREIISELLDKFEDYYDGSDEQFEAEPFVVSARNEIESITDIIGDQYDLNKKNEDEDDEDEMVEEEEDQDE